MVKAENLVQLLQLVEKERLYVYLVAQLNKDFRLSGLKQEFSSDLTPQELTAQLQEIVYELISDNFDDYLNLLYRVDLSEVQVKTLDGSNLDKLSHQVAFLILKREFQKVWLKNNF